MFRRTCGDCRLLFLLQAGHRCVRCTGIPCALSMRGTRTMHYPGIFVPRECGGMSSGEIRPRAVMPREGGASSFPEAPLLKPKRLRNTGSPGRAGRSTEGVESSCLKFKSDVRKRPSHLSLGIARIALRLLRLLVLFGSAVVAVGAAGGRAQQAVVAGVMAGDAADDRALDAALGVGR